MRRRAPRHHVSEGPVPPSFLDPQGTPLPEPPEACMGNPDCIWLQCDSELDGLVPTVSALSSPAYDIAQVVEAYGCFEEDRVPSLAFISISLLSESC